ncbi:putative permease [Raineya orbicola]|jgi:predicted permease|uniref:Putative permease n=2 Tax=Raineya orbicola TaxID=2016530 RepID=A0A2N3II32_9BACT|nr:putative permease [Raineya orbicola]
MSNLLLILFCFAAGFFLKTKHKHLNLPANTPQGINAFVLYVSLPAMAFYYVPKIEFSLKALVPLTMGLIVLLGAVLFFAFLQKMLHYDKKVLGCLVLCSGLGNVSFLGYPLIEAFYGKEGIKTAVLCDQGTFLVLSTLGILLANFYAGKQATWKVIGLKLLHFPAFTAFLIALGLNFVQIDFPEIIQSVWKRFADALSPLALFSVGWQISWEKENNLWKETFAGLFYKLLLIPCIFWLFIPQPMGLAEKVVILQTAMAPMITASIIAVEYHLAPNLANLLIRMGVPISLLTTSFWWWLMG